MTWCATKRGEVGFTIIEVVLFLAITGVMIAGLLIGIGYSVTRQQYSDSVNSFAAVMQQQYDAVVNVSSDRGSGSGVYVRDGSSIVCPSADPSAGNIGTQGRSECTIIGRRIVSNGTTLTIEPIIAQQDYNRLKEPFLSLLNSLEASTTPYNEIDSRVLQASELKVYDGTKEEYSPAWGAIMHAPGVNERLAFTMVILRSPYSGAVRTYIDTSAAPASPYWQTILSQVNATRPLTICLDAGLPAPQYAVTVAAGSSSANGVKIEGADRGC